MAQEDRQKLDACAVPVIKHESPFGSSSIADSARELSNLVFRCRLGCEQMTHCWSHTLSQKPLRNLFACTLSKIAEDVLALRTVLLRAELALKSGLASDRSTVNLHSVKAI